MSDKRSNRQLGDCLLKGLENEVSTLIAEEDEDVHFYLLGSVAYLHLRGDLNVKGVQTIYNCLEKKEKSNVSVGKYMEEIVNVLVTNLSKKYKFDSMQELVKVLNNFRIPIWCFQSYKKMELGEYSHQQCFLMKDEKYLYYTVENRVDGCALVQMEVNHIDEDFDFEYTLLGNMLFLGASEIYDVDREQEKIYFQFQREGDIYGCYDIRTNNCELFRGRFLELINGTPYIITEDGYWACVRDQIYKMRKYVPCEKYELRDDHFYIYPELKEHTFERPYKLYFNGNIKPASLENCKKVLWDCMIRSFTDEHPFTRCLLYPGITLMAPDDFTLSNIYNAMRAGIPEKTWSSSPSEQRIDNIVKILVGIVNADDDIVDLLYAICEIDAEISSLVAVFPSEEITNTLIVADELGKGEFNLSEAVQKRDYDAFKRYIRKCADGLGLVKQINKETPKIGGFSKSTEGLMIYTQQLSAGKYLGNQLVPRIDIDTMDGIVSYDTHGHYYFIASDKMLDDSEINQIKKEFGILRCRVNVVIQKQGGIEDA